MTHESSLPSDTRVLQEQTYKFGVGPVLVHSVEVVAEVSFNNTLWLHVRAQVANGDWRRHGQFVSREIYVDPAAMGSRGHRGTRPSAP